MASHKQQHYVPRCYLKPFSQGGEGKSINIVNLSRVQAIRCCPVKGQCAKSYFYGEDLKLEHILRDIEGSYSTLLTKVLAEVALTEGELSFIRDFMFLQFRRTDMAIQRIREMSVNLENKVFENREWAREHLDTSDKSLIARSIELFVDTRHAVQDLKLCLLRNQTKHSFITSDDPSVLTNRFHLQRLKRTTFGFASAGTQFFLPMSPRYVMVAYDKDVYTIPDKVGHVVALTDIGDVLAVNELQYLNAAENVYFSDWSERERLVGEVKQAAANRTERWSKLSVLVHDKDTETGETYTRGTESERATATKRVFVSSATFPYPTCWCSKFQFRTPLKAYSNGSAAGWVRRKEWLERSFR